MKWIVYIVVTGLWLTIAVVLFVRTRRHQRALGLAPPPLVERDNPLRFHGSLWFRIGLFGLVAIVDPDLLSTDGWGSNATSLLVGLGVLALVTSIVVDYVRWRRARL